jgi:hypothetical protein
MKTLFLLPVVVLIAIIEASKLLKNKVYGTHREGSSESA